MYLCLGNEKQSELEDKEAIWETSEQTGNFPYEVQEKWETEIYWGSDSELQQQPVLGSL